MKLAILLAILSLNINLAFAEEEPVLASDEIAAYCEDQAQLAGLEEGDEKNNHIKTCVASFSTQSDGSSQAE